MMNVLYRIVILVFCIYGSYCVEYDYREEQLNCIRSCQSSKRLCHQPPRFCGGCLPTYEEDGTGICQPKRVAEPVIIAAKKEEMGINYAVNQSAGDIQQQPASSTFTTDILFIAVIVSVSAAALLGFIIAIICWCKLKKSAKETSEFDYPSYGSVDYKGSETGTKSGDRRLAQSAQMYHYQHQKQQMLEMEKNRNAVSKSGSEASSDEENDASEYTVYECPGLATAGEMEVPNPLFVEPPANALYPEIPQHSMESHEAGLVNGCKEP